MLVSLLVLLLLLLQLVPGSMVLPLVWVMLVDPVWVLLFEVVVEGLESMV